MSTNCERCGYRDNEVKSGSAISEKGKRITLKVEDRDDLSRDILKVGLFRLILSLLIDRDFTTPRAKPVDCRYRRLI